MPGGTEYLHRSPSQRRDRFGCRPPFSEAAFFVFGTAIFPEAAVFLEKQKLLITTDSIQYWSDWSNTSTFTRLALWLMGFRLTLLIGPPWLKRVTPGGSSLLPDFEKLAALDFEHVIGAHGSLLRSNAKPLLKKAIARAFSGSASG